MSSDKVHNSITLPRKIEKKVKSSRTTCVCVWVCLVCKMKKFPEHTSVNIQHGSSSFIQVCVCVCVCADHTLCSNRWCCTSQQMAQTHTHTRSMPYIHYMQQLFVKWVCELDTSLSYIKQLIFPNPHRHLNLTPMFCGVNDREEQKPWATMMLTVNAKQLLQCNQMVHLSASKYVHYSAGFCHWLRLLL